MENTFRGVKSYISERDGLAGAVTLVASCICVMLQDVRSVPGNGIIRNPLITDSIPHGPSGDLISYFLYIQRHPQTIILR